MVCDRCHRDTPGHTGSMFNADTVCFDCKKVEEGHPDYQEARRVEGEHVLRGDYNFPGVGLPDGYDAWAAPRLEALR